MAPEVDKQNVHEDEKTLSSTYRKTRDGEMKVFIDPRLLLNVNMKQVTGCLSFSVVVGII